MHLVTGIETRGESAPAQVQVSQAVIGSQPLGQPLHPRVGEGHLPQVELPQSLVQPQHGRQVHRRLVLMQGAMYHMTIQ